MMCPAVRGGRTLTVRHALHAWHEREEVYTGIYIGILLYGVDTRMVLILVGIQLGKLCGANEWLNLPSRRRSGACSSTWKGSSVVVLSAIHR